MCAKKNSAVEVWKPSKGGALAGMGLDHNPFALMDVNDADQNLGATLPLRRIEYVASQDAKDADLTRGLITDAVAMTQKETVRCVLLSQKFSRAYLPTFDPKADEQEPPYCVSLDGKTRTRREDDSDEIPDDQACARCKHSKWGKNREKPDCSEIYTLLLWDIDDQLPFVFNIRRTGIPPWRKGRTNLKVQAMKHHKGGVPANLCVSFELGSREKETYYLPTFSDFEPVDDDTIEMLVGGIESLMASFQDVDPTAVEPEEPENLDDATDFPPKDEGDDEPPAPSDGDAGPDGGNGEDDEKDEKPEPDKKSSEKGGGFKNSAFARK